MPRDHTLEADADSLDFILSNLERALFELQHYKERNTEAGKRNLAARAMALVMSAEEILRPERTALAVRLANLLPKEQTK